MEKTLRLRRKRISLSRRRQTQTRRRISSMSSFATRRRRRQNKVNKRRMRLRIHRAGKVNGGGGLFGLMPDTITPTRDISDPSVQPVGQTYGAHNPYFV